MVGMFIGGIAIGMFLGMCLMCAFISGKEE